MAAKGVVGKKDLVLESPEKVIIFFGGFFQNLMNRDEL